MEALGLLELSSIARGPVVVDAMVKRAAVRVLRNEPMSGGKLLILARGGQAEMQESMEAALDAASGVLLDSVHLPHAHTSLWTLMGPETLAYPVTDAAGMVETATMAAAVLGADVAVKAAGVTLVEIRLGRGIGGKGTFALTGPLDDVQAALDAVRQALVPERLVAAEIIARPHEDLASGLYWRG